MDLKTIQPKAPAFSGSQVQPRPQVSFGGGQHEIHFGASDREGVKGGVSLLGRIWNRLVRKGHANEDEKLKQPEHAVAFLRSERDKLVKDLEAAIDIMETNIAERDVLVREDLPKLIDKVEKEKAEAAQARQAFLNMSEDDPNYARQDAYQRKEVKEWQEAEAELKKLQERIEEKNKKARNAELTIKQSRTRIAEIKQIVKDAESNAAEEKANAAQKRAIGILEGTATSDQFNDIVNHLRVQRRKSEVSINLDDRLFELEQKEKAKEDAALAELDAALGSK